jgi:hypothetical protein
MFLFMYENSSHGRSVRFSDLVYSKGICYLELIDNFPGEKVTLESSYLSLFARAIF